MPQLLQVQGRGRFAAEQIVAVISQLWSEMPPKAEMHRSCCGDGVKNLKFELLR